ncbi:hypothetical protein [Streptomyces sp. NPDC059575]|uniref:hypothetical protein n=1 Tax=Streptomyces sp. NPDC059575 TaxID=3346872 RepID=UPI0036B3BE4D
MSSTPRWFSDNVDPRHTALSDLVGTAGPHTPAVLAGPFDIRSAPSHGVIVCTGTGPVRTMAALVEKPDPPHARQLADDHGPDNLRLLLGRVRLTPGLLHHMSATAHRTATEPRLSLALAAYARHHRVDIVTVHTPMVDLGAPDPARPHVTPYGARQVQRGRPSAMRPADAATAGLSSQAAAAGLGRRRVVPAAQRDANLRTYRPCHGVSTACRS